MRTLQSVPAIRGEAPMHRGAVGRRAFAGRIYRWGGVVALGAALLLPACTILPKAEPLDVYLLPATAPVSASATQAAPWSLRIARPAAGAHLSGQRIVVVPEDNRVSVYTGAGWSAADVAAGGNGQQRCDGDVEPAPGTTLQGRPGHEVQGRRRRART